MKCHHPLYVNMQVVPCGQCTACLINRRRVWVTRMMMEASQWSDSAFATLTYAPENLPYTELGQPIIPTLRKRHAQLFLKRLRKRLGSRRFKYFLVGEYGDVTQRPHYHVAFFGLEGSRSTAMGLTTRSDTLSGAPAAIHAAWGLGFTSTGILAKESMEYVAGYVVKKWTRVDDVRLDGREPEFSLKSGNLGSGMLHEIASELLPWIDRMDDVPAVVRFQGKPWPIGQALKRKLRTMVGRQANSPQAAKDKLAREVQPMKDFAFKNNRSFKEVLRELYQGDADALVGKDEIRRSRKRI